MAITKPKSNKRTLSAQKTKEKLYQTSLKLFSKYGYNAVTIEDITSIAGLSKGTFYTYFHSKDDILLDVFHQIDHRYEEVFADIPETMLARYRIFLLIDTMANYCSKDVGLQFMKVVYANQVSSTNNSVRILNDSQRTFYRIARETVVLGKKNHEFPDVPDEEFTEMMIRFARSIIYDWCLYDGQFDLETEAHKYFTVLLDSFLALASK